MNALTLLLAAVTLTADTSNPVNSFFSKDEKATVTYSVKGLEPGAKTKLTAQIFDELEKQVVELPALEVTADAKGEWTGSAALPTARYGFYRLKAQCGAARLPKVGSRRPDCITFAVVYDPGKRKQYPVEETFYGTCGGGPDVYKWFGTTFAYGGSQPLDPARYARHLKNGGTVPTERGTIIAESADRLAEFLPQEGKDYFKKVGAKGLALYKLLDTEEGRKWYRQALQEMAKAAREQIKGRRIYEVTSEPDLALPGPEMVVKQTKFASEILHEADPEGLVFGPTLSSFNKGTFFRQLCELGIFRYLDAFGIHPYGAFPPEPNGQLTRIRELRRLVREQKGRDILMGGTEGGYCVPSTTATDLAQALGMTRLQLILLGEGFDFNCMFYPTDFGNDGFTTREGDYGITSNLELETRRFGPNKASPRPAAAMISAATRFTEGHRSTGCLEGIFGETTLGYSYATKDDSCVIALWDWGNTGAVAELNVGCDEIEVADEWGNERRVRTKKGVLTLKLTERPQYVIEPRPALWGRKGTEAKRLQAEAEKKAAAREAARELALQAFEPTVLADGTLGVAGTVENRQPRDLQVTFETRVRGIVEARGAVTETLKPREVRRIVVPLGGFSPDPFRTYKVETCAKTASGYLERLSADENFLVAEKVPAGTAASAFANWKNPHYRETPAGLTNTTLRLAIGWNERYLYFDALVEDDSFAPTMPGWFSWNGDAIQLGLAKGVLLKSTENTQTDLKAEAHTETTFALTADGPQAYRTRTYDYKELPSGTSQKDLRGLVSPKECPFEVTTEKIPSGTRIRYRIAVPWRFMEIRGEPPHAGESCRFALYVCDRDPGMRSMEHTNRLFELQAGAPKRFGRIVFGK